MLVWPTFVAEPARRREEYALNLAAAIFNDPLRQRVRNELGKSYNPQVATAMPDNADQGYLAAQLESNPAELDVLIAEAKSVGLSIAGGALTADALDAVRKPMLSSAAARRGQNSWWAGALDGSARTTAITEEVTKYETLLSSVTLDEVKAAAARWLAAVPIVVIATPEKAAGANGATQAAEGARK